MVPLSHYLVLGAALFGIGLIGVLIRRNFAAVIMAFALMGNAVVLNFAAFSRSYGATDGQVVALLALGVFAAEIAMGIALFFANFRSQRRVDTDEMDRLKW